VSAALFPLFADLRGRAVRVVGGGAVAERKVEALLIGGGEIKVISPTGGATAAATGSDRQDRMAAASLSYRGPGRSLSRHCRDESA